MNPEDIKNWTLAGSAFISIAKEMISMLPSKEMQDKAELSLRKLEFEFKNAQASSAQKMGFNVCLRCWPPEIMLMNDDDVAICSKCAKSDSSAYNKKMKDKD